MKKTKYLVLFSLFAMNLVEQPAPEVEIDSGVLSGRISADGDILEYVGIPYATAERFQAPKPPPKWKGEFKAIDGSSQCPQPTPLGVAGTEDCLKINVYVPAKARRPLPVMFYVHGGAFLLGSGGKMLLGPDLLLKHDVILVTFNYRLGALGFLCLGIEEVPGNAGLKDQIAALKWVQRNIAVFGGDPDNVTIFGHSAGGASVALLLASEATNGLFKKVIVQSGSSLANWAINPKPVEIAKSIAKQLLSLDTDDPLELYEFYKNVPYNDLIESTANIPIGKLLALNLLHLPCVEKEFRGIEPAITDSPYNLLNKNPKNISVIYGSTDKEGLFFISEETEDSLKNANEKHLFGNDLLFKNEDEANRVSQKVKQFYFGMEDISFKTKMNLSDIFSHLYFEVPAILESNILKSRVEAPIFNYYFTYSGGRNMVKERTGFGNVTGACHGDDILYLFHALIWPYRIKQKDHIMINWLTKMWTNFAKFGNPTPHQDNDLPVKWEPSTRNKWNFLHIGDELKMGPLPNPDSYNLWKDIYEEYRNINFTKV
ncbi:esterase FE4 [Manduca sexta]|uniref:Carboxylic ester hydrolase n=2 Tax=Manduca sexta TaxID=7130 RepID=A0A921ZDG4_MANSE|nr:esterase FE4 [Manduca sexta]KAG6455366.1 hypothetical protein O3G_MSEX009167 [Manduca sexta]UXP71992.1 esterase [Manduca sexta]